MNKKNYLLALISAFLMWLAWPPHVLFAPILLIGLVPLFIALNNISQLKEKRNGKQFFLTAGLTFLVWNTACIYWVYNAVSADNNPIVSLLISLIPFGLGALLMTLAFWLYYKLNTKVNQKLAYLGLISFYISTEYLHQSWDLAFPWMTLGNGFSGMHQLVQWYEYTGVYGGSLWILLSNILAFEAYKSLKTQSGFNKYKGFLIWGIVVILPIGFSSYTYNNYQEKVLPINVVAVQPNINPYQKFSAISVQSQFDILKRLSDSIAQPNTEYFIWPETALPLYEDEDKIRANFIFLQAQQFLSKYKNGNLITGIESRKFYNRKETISAKVNPNGGFYDSFNAAIQVENSAKVNFYHKSKLVPGVEKMPFPETLAFLAPVFEKLGGSSSGWGWQQNPGVFYSQNGVGVAPVICYESIWGGWVAQSVKNGAQFIAIITNDGWWGNTSGKDQHLMYAKLRAIETRRWVVRSANTGISAFINQKGDVVKQSNWWTSTAIKEDVNLNDNLTFYVKNGDFLAKIFSILAVLLLLTMLFKKWIKPNINKKA